LNDPDLMFRRFRYKDEDGEWRTRWKKRERTEDGRYHFVNVDKDTYKTGPGVYKSSYMNAMRVTRTETNMAYRRADHDRWQRLDFVLGQHIEPSGQHPKEDICDELAGDYPKDFVFEGWHPQCMCVCTPILATEEQMRAEMDAVLNGDDDYQPEYTQIEEYPEGFQQFVDDNADDIAESYNSGTAPYFVQNNPDIIEDALNGELPVEGREAEEEETETKKADEEKAEETKEEKLTALQIAERRHASRTEEQIKALRDYRDKKTGLTAEQVKNLEEVEKELGITRGVPMSFKAADGNKANPLYFLGDHDHTTNCQTCVVANEMRRRGFNVEAVGRTAGGAWADALAWDTTAIWKDEQGNKPTPVYFASRSAKGAAMELEGMTSEKGRYHVNVFWKNGGGHIITCERTEDGGLRYYDPQTGEMVGDIEEYLRDVRLWVSRVYRVDNLTIDPDATKSLFKKPTK
ncbi:MAG: hypothetical protein LUI09_04540, partial [Prevotellaceae bacterium]|nr:hypothetical protein [Prevotellaceae bacterium]